MKPIQVLESGNAWSTKNRMISDFLNNYFQDSAGSRVVDILEAGCGTKWDLELKMNYVLTGIDVSREAMERRKERHNDIDDFIVGDLATVPIQKDAFDVVYCSYVMEHLYDAEAVLDRFFEWLRSGGLAILIFPDRSSVFGFVARLTPHWFHVFYYKYVIKYPHAGKPGHAPFPTFYDPVVSLGGMRDYCHDRGHGLELEFALPFKPPKAAGVLAPIIAASVKLIAACSFGRLTGQHQNIALIIKKG